MKLKEALKRIAELEAIGITAVMTIVVFGKTDDEHEYALRMIY